MAKHHPDLVMCRKQPGVAIGRLCEKCKRQPRMIRRGMVHFETFSLYSYCCLLFYALFVDDGFIFFDFYNTFQAMASA